MPHRPCSPLTCCQIVTPLVVDKWEEYLRSHPDNVFTSFVLRGIANGFHIGCDYSNTVIRSSCSSMPAAREHPDIVINYLKKELDLGRVAAVPHEAVSLIHTSSFGVIPKKSQPGKWRFIVDLSSSHGSSVNDYIDQKHSFSPTSQWMMLPLTSGYQVRELC